MVAKNGLKINNDVPRPEGLFGVRHFQYVLMLGLTVLGYGMRIILNVAIVAMIGESKGDYPTYPEWRSKKNLILSSFFWGYITLQVGAGVLGRKYGPKIFLFTALSTASLLTILIPFFSKWFGYQGVIISRVIQGMCQGFLLPSLHGLLSSWCHISERARWGGIIYAGSALGNVFAMPITGAICASKAGWPLIFYVYGTMGIIWCTLWLIFGCDRPSKHRSISKEERNWLESDQVVDISELKKLETPWKSIFTSLPFISVILANAGQNWGFWALLTEIPSYMNDILHYDISSNSNITAIPYLVMFLLNLVLSSIADYIIDKRIVSLVLSRKVFNTIGFFVPAIALIFLACTGTKDRTLVITALIIGVGFNSAQYSGYNVNHIDLAPNHASTLMGITNSLGTIFSIFAPLAVDLIHSVTGYSETEVQLWNIDFFLAAGIYISTGIVFVIFGSGEIQSWNYAGLEGDAERQQTPDKRTRDVLRKISVISNT